MPQMRVTVTNVDDGAKVFVNGDEILHVDFRKSGAKSFFAEDGDEIRMQILNLTGGAWCSRFRLWRDNRLVYDKSPRGWSVPFQPEAWADEFIV